MCVDTTTNPAFCGNCDNNCIDDFQHQATGACGGGMCALGTCEDGWDNCDFQEETGCETDVWFSFNHCGTCNTTTCNHCRQGACSPPFTTDTTPRVTPAVSSTHVYWNNNNHILTRKALGGGANEQINQWYTGVNSHLVLGPTFAYGVDRPSGELVAAPLAPQSGLEHTTTIYADSTLTLFDLAADATRIFVVQYNTAADGLLMTFPHGAAFQTNPAATRTCGMRCRDVTAGAARVCWTSSTVGPPENSTIKCVNNDLSGTITTVAANQGNVGSLTQDGAYVYWVSSISSQNYAIRRAPLDGSVAAMDVVPSRFVSTGEVFMTVRGNFLYYSQSLQLYRVDLSTMQTTQLGYANVYKGLTMDAANVYWMDDAGNLMRVAP